MSSAPTPLADDGISFRELWDILWSGRWIILASVAICAVGAVAYVLTATEWYRAEVLLAPAEERATPSLSGQLGGLVALAGVSVGGGDSAEAIATLRSRELAHAFIEDLGLLPVFFAHRWDASAGRWRGENPARWPDVRDAVKFFHERVLHVSEDRQTGLVTVGIEWTDGEVAARWAEEIVQRVNARLRQRALRDAEANVAYLQTEIAQTGVLSLQQSISRLLENELQKLMLARGNEEFAFRVVDAPQAPRDPIRPNRVLTVILGTLLGGVVGVFIVVVRHAVRATGSRA
jgi:uncharacterized protein involved in exopolysaccharide biosynthesis